MDNCDVQLVGGPCGQHGPYTFYKAFKYTKNGIKRVVTLSEFFFVKLWIDSDLLCIGELQLLWIDKNSDQVLASLRLYFLPENTPEGRMDHGEDEVLAISEKVVLRVEDLITWITVDAEWTWGRLAKCESEINEPKLEENKTFKVLTENSLDSADIEKERKSLEGNKENEGPSVIILSYPRYCRFRAMTKRLENVENDYLKCQIVSALGGVTSNSKNTRVLFCKDTFDYPELEGHELLCNHLAPKLKGRPRGKRKKRSVSPGSESNESESSVTNVFSSSKILSEPSCSGLHLDASTSLRRSTRSQENSESKEFFKKLCVFMKANQTPIGRVPSLGYKEIDLHSFYVKVQKLGGYDSVTANRLWKSIFDEMSGHQNSTSAATVIRRHYERFLLPYERHVKGEEYKPLPISERRRLKSKAGSSNSDAETSEGTSRSGNSTPVPQLINSAASPVNPPTTPPDNKESLNQIKSEGKTSSLRSVRVKPERQKDKQISNSKSDVQISNNNNNNNNNNDDNTSNNNNINSNINNNVKEPDIKQEVLEDNTEENLKSVSDNINNKTDNNNIKIEGVAIKSETTNLPDKNAEPLTSAVAPVVQKINPDKSLSPVEGKENIPIIKTGDTANTNNKIGEIIEVPYKPKSPEIVDLESDTYKSITANLSKPLIHEVKKRKLDILKEGGLEVTPVRPFIGPPLPPVTKDARPSVIQQTSTQITAKMVRNDLHNMPPPSINSVPSKRLHLQIPQTINISQIVQQNNNNKNINNKSPLINNQSPPCYMNGCVPPKIVQSNSIYSHSEKTVYGDPKDVLTQPTNPHLYYPHHPHQYQKYYKHYTRQLNDDVLDLTIKNQRPVVEIMRIPNIQSSQQLPPTSLPQTFHNSLSIPPPPTNYRDSSLKHRHKHPPPPQPSQPQQPSTPLLDGRRLGSNLEITLVGGPNNRQLSANVDNYYTSKHNAQPLPPPQSPAPSRHYSTNEQRYSQKRISADNNYNNHKIPRLEENGRYPSKPQISTMPTKDSHISIPSHMYGNNRNSSNLKSDQMKMTPSHHITQHMNNKNLYNPNTPTTFPYLSQFYDSNKGMSPYLPLLDPLYYSAAFQSLYSHNALNSAPPILPFPSTEQLKLYSDLMAHNSRLNFPFQIPPDGNPSIVNSKHSKKP